MSLPESQKAVVIQGPGKAELVSDRPLPQLRDGYILVKTVAVAINPTDWKHIDYRADAGALVGCDYSGTVEAVGKGVTKSWKKGDKVYGFVHGSSTIQHENGAFAEYIVAKGDLQSHMPESMSFEEAATLGVGVCTVGQALYQSLKLPLPTEPAKKPLPLMIYGGSTATGTLAIQFAKLYVHSCLLLSCFISACFPRTFNHTCRCRSNLEVLTTSSPKNFSLCTSFGADSTFDYNDPTCAEQIRDATSDALHHAFDCISLPPTAAICAAALSSKGGAYSSLIPIEKLPREDIENKYTLAYTVTGESFKLGPTGLVVEGKQEDYAFAREWWGISEKIFMEGKVKVHPVSVRKGGLRGVLEGLQEMREGKVSGEKLVYRVAETV